MKRGNPAADSDSEDATPPAKYCSGRKFCPHCSETVSMKTYKFHKRLHFDQVAIVDIDASCTNRGTYLYQSREKWLTSINVSGDEDTQDELPPDSPQFNILDVSNSCDSPPNSPLFILDKSSSEAGMLDV